MSSESNIFSKSFKDFEEELDQFFIRRQCDATVSTNVSRSSKIALKGRGRMNLYDEPLLLICDIPSVDKFEFAENTMVFQAFGISFRNCILHGRVVGHSLHNDKYCKYIMDDGTGSIEISIFRRQSDQEKVLRLEKEIESWKLDCHGQNKLEITDCLRRLLAKAKDALNFSNIPIGSKILVYGKPDVFRGKVGIDVFSLFITEHIENLEIEFKDLLIEWYSEKYDKFKLNNEALLAKDPCDKIL